jgi:hypothetical protein
VRDLLLHLAGSPIHAGQIDRYPPPLRHAPDPLLDLVGGEARELQHDQSLARGLRQIVDVAGQQAPTASRLAEQEDRTWRVARIDRLLKRAQVQ